MLLEYFDSEMLDPTWTDYFWKQNVCMDDWDYMVITHDIDAFEEVKERDDYTNELVSVITPKSWYLRNILNGCCGNVWQKIIWKGKEAIIGIAYHS
jgi:hypothetical protein